MSGHAVVMTLGSEILRTPRAQGMLLTLVCWCISLGLMVHKGGCYMKRQTGVVHLGSYPSNCILFCWETHTLALILFFCPYFTQNAWNKWDFQQESCNLFFLKKKQKTFLKFKYGWFAMLCLFQVYSKEGWSWRNQAPWLQTILQSYNNQNIMLLTHMHTRTHTHTHTHTK